MCCASPLVNPSRPGGDPGAKRSFLSSTPIHMLPRRGSICGRLTYDLPLGCLQGGACATSHPSRTRARPPATLEKTLGQMAPPKSGQPLRMLPESGGIPPDVHFWEVPFALMLSSGWILAAHGSAPPCVRGTAFFSSLLLSSLELSDTTIYEP